MSAKQRIEALTNAWYGFAIFAAAISFLQRGIGIFSLMIVAVSLAFSLASAFFVGRRLLRKSSLTRSFLLFTSVVSGLWAAWSCYRYGTAFFGEWSFSLLLKLALAGGTLSMDLRSFRVLTDASVKSYFR